MPWKETAPMNEREKFVRAHLSGVWSMTELCERFGISRKNGYKWLARFQAEGRAGLADRSSAPHTCPHRTPEHVREAILEIRRRKPNWGPGKCLDWLRKFHPELPLPAISTAGALLDRHGLVKKRSRRRRWKHPGRPTLRPIAPNELWTIDFKGQFRTGDGVYCYPLTVADEYSRYLLECKGLGSVRTEEAQPVIERLFRRVGLPDAIRSDNGSPFSSTGLHGLCALSVWWIRLGIQHQRIRPGEPQDNPCHERMHRTLKDETARPPAASRRAQQRTFDRFRAEFNEDRPHEALKGDLPVEHWRPSQREYPSRMSEPEYPGHFEKRRVSTAGCFRFKRTPIFISQALKNEWIGLEEIEDGIWSVMFYDVLLARLDARTKELYT